MLLKFERKRQLLLQTCFHPCFSIASYLLSVTVSVREEVITHRLGCQLQQS